ncbi:MAG: ATP-binding protein [Roseburia sp.]|nr:ATP-binding protein [Ruminococcus sp.]MCM1155322.1 ATP-binding protein [Roseburia sp.]MCM1243009.1 ATP-binding protein [Roseburia sp.]
MLAGRMSELEYLNQYYEQKGSQMLVVYGQKHIGKTTLVKAFAQDKPNDYYLARACSEREQMYQWGMQLRADEREESETGRETFSGNGKDFPDFADIFAVFGGNGSKRVIIIDEFQNIVKVSDTFMKELVSFLRAQEEKGGVMILLCSSSIGWIENSMITRIGEAAYALSGLLKIRELSFGDIVHRFPNFRIEECVEAYAILGGIPGLWNQFDDKLTIQQNICRHILNPDSLLFEEGERMVAEQLRETSVYNTILAAIAAGKHKLNDIYRHTAFSRAKISVYLKNLMELELVEKVFSYDGAGKENAQKGIYRIIHPFVEFYFTYMYPYMSALQTISVGEYYNTYIYPNFRKYVSGSFKKVCRQYLEKLNERGKLPIHYETSGEWVGKEGSIDLIARDAEGKTLIVLCNWEKPMMTYADYEWVISCAERARIKADYIYLYTASGFDEKLNLEAKIKKNLRLIQISDV